jgi:hypothetical protein
VRAVGLLAKAMPVVCVAYKLTFTLTKLENINAPFREQLLTIYKFNILTAIISCNVTECVRRAW